VRSVPSGGLRMSIHPRQSGTVERASISNRICRIERRGGEAAVLDFHLTGGPHVAWGRQQRNEHTEAFGGISENFHREGLFLARSMARH